MMAEQHIFYWLRTSLSGE